MGIGSLCISFSVKSSRRSKKRTKEELQPPERPPPMDTALSNSLILNEILARLPRKELLNARLVSHAWNSEALSILRRQNAVISIDGRNYQSYLFQLLKTSQASHPVTASIGPGLCYNYRCDPSLKLRVSIERYANQQEFDKISLGIATLVRLFESRSCIDSVHIGRGLGPKTHCGWLRLLKSLSICGAGLRHITINCAIVLDPPEEQGQVLQSPINTNPKAIADARLLLECLNFPQLESMNLTLALGTNFSVLAMTAMINAAPRVRRLVLNGNGNSTSKYNCQLVQILRSLRPCSLSWLEELELDIGNGSCFQALRLLGPLSQLTTLRLQCSNNNYPRLAPVVDQAQHFNMFLRSNCPRLTSLYFYFEPSNGGVSAGQEFPLGLPTLPNLVSLGYHGGTTESCCYINVHKTALPAPSAMFPALRTISTNLGAMLSFGQNIWSATGEENGAAGAQAARLKFEQVDTLYLKFHCCVPGNQTVASPAASPSASGGRCLVEDNVHQLRTLYPNVRQLVLDNEFNESPNDGVADVLFLVLLRFQSLEKLEIRNYYRDWMCLVLAETGKAFTQLKELTLSTSDRATYSTEQTLVEFNLTSVAALLHFLPNLTCLRVSRDVLVSTDWVTCGEYVNWYPNLRIMVI